MNTLSFFNPRFTSDLFDVIDRNFSDLDNMGNHYSSPRVDVMENKESYVLQMELPGLTENDVAIDLKDRVISIGSIAEEKKAEKEEKKEAVKKPVYLVKERFSSSFTRSFTLPEDIDSENVSAKFQNGLLEVTIPRKAESKARRIMICA